MKVDGRHFRSIWLSADGWSVGAIDQRRLPHEFVVTQLTNCADAAEAIHSMLVRGAPLIGATAAFGMALAMREDASDAAIERAYQMLMATRPTAINLKWALEAMRAILKPLGPSARVEAAYARAEEIAEEDVAINRSIAHNGVSLIEAIAAKKPGEMILIRARGFPSLGARTWPSAENSSAKLKSASRHGTAVPTATPSTPGSSLIRRTVSLFGVLFFRPPVFIRPF